MHGTSTVDDIAYNYPWLSMASPICTLGERYPLHIELRVRPKNSSSVKWNILSTHHQHQQRKGLLLLSIVMNRH
jgi:hypothetical protein